MNPNDRIKDILKGADIIGEKSIEAYEREIKKIYVNGLRNLRLQVSEVFSLYGKKDAGILKVPYDTMIKYGRLDNLSAKASKEFANTNKEVNSVLRKAILESYENNYYLHSFAVDSSLNINFAFKFLDANAIRAALINPYTSIQWPERLREHTAILNRRVQDAIVQTFQQGLGYKKAAKMYAESFGVTNSAATRILWTETHRAQNAARLASFDQVQKSADRLGLDVERLWGATLDARTRPDHQGLDGQPADEEGFWEISGIRTAGPGLSGSAAFDIHCRCTTITQFPDMPNKYRYDSVEGKQVEYQTYPEWQEKHNIKPKYGTWKI